MRQRKFAYALLAASVSTPVAAADVIPFSIFGTITGTRTTILCNSGSPASCLSGGGSRNDPFLQAFSINLGTQLLAQGDTQFTWGHPRVSGQYSFIINNNNSVLTGRNLLFAYEDTGVRFGQIGSSWVNASAASFSVMGGIPEPATWAMMIIGFGAIGWQFRRQRRAVVTAIPTA